MESDVNDFAGFAASTASITRPKYNLDGRYRAQVTAVMWKDSFKTGSRSYVIETVCTASDIAEIRVGQLRTITINRLFDKATFQRNSAQFLLKGFLMACIVDKFGPEANAALNDLATAGPGASEKDPTRVKSSDEKWVEFIDLSTKGVFVGCEVGFNVKKTVTKKSKSPGEPGFDASMLFDAITFDQPV